MADGSIPGQHKADRKALSGFFLVVLVTLAIALAGYKISEQQLVAVNGVSHSHEIRARLASVRGTLVDLETGARGYVITGRERYLEPHISALVRLDAELRQLRTLVSDDPRQLSRLFELEEAIRPRIKSSQQIVATRRAHGFDAAQKLFDSELPQLQMDRLRGILKELEQEEQRLLMTRIQAEDSIMESFWIGMAVLIAILLIAEGMLYQSIRNNSASRSVLLQTLAEKEQGLSRFRAALDIAPGAVFLTDATTLRIIDVNEMACRMTGYSRAELLAMVTRDLFVATSSDALLDAYDALVSGKVPVQIFEAHAKRKDGGQYPVEVTRRHLTVGDTQIIVGVARDVSERNEIQRQLRNNQEQLEAALAQTTQHNRDITTLAELGEVLQSCTTPEESYAPIAKWCGVLFSSSRGALFLMHNSRNYLESVAQWGDTLGSKEVFAPTECWALRRGQPHRLDSAVGLRCPHLENGKGVAHLCVPLTALGDTLGVLYLELDETQALDRLQDLAIMTAERIALAVANLRLRKTLSNQSIRDALTGLYNRRYLEESLQQEFARAKRSGKPLAVMMLDVDHFKQFNDIHGHDAGDAVLRTVGKLLSEQFRGSDTVCRYGGEEFTVMLPETGSADAEAKANKLRTVVSNCSSDWNGKALAGITVSIGMVTYPDYGDNPQMLMDAADAALYEAKRSGRNRVVVWRGTPASNSANESERQQPPTFSAT